MDNYTKAINIVEEGLANNDPAHHIVSRLAGYGLIAPDLPEPDGIRPKGWPRWKLHGYGDHNDTVHVAYIAGDVFINSPSCNMSARADDAAALARVIHAAAYYPKGWAQA